MAELYVRMEAVNLANFTEDVHDLSTIRGGSFLLLDAVGAVEKEFSLAPISTGASAGLFSRASDEEPAALRAAIETFLHDDPRFRHATFVVDVRRQDEFHRTREALAAMNRWRQFQQPTVAVPSPAASPSGEECQYDHVRPAIERRHTADGVRALSTSVDVRRTHGRHQKQEFYASELRKLRSDAPDDADLESLIRLVSGARFVNDLETLTSDQHRKRLHLKMAVVYFDGNKFGNLQRACESPEELRALDRTIKTFRRRALRALLERIFASRDNGWWVTPEDGTGEAVRLETLLWGGDELIWVVPAWKGWEVVQLFYEVSKSWEHETRPLTHAGGLVFCHRGAPIHRMRGTAHALADVCKERIEKSGAGPSHFERDLFAYQIFESTDMTGGSLSAFRRERVPLSREEHAAHDLIVRAAGMDAVAGDFEEVKRTFPRSKLHDIVLDLRDPHANAEEVAALIDATVGDLDPSGRDALRRLFRFFGRNEDELPWHTAPTGWFHIADLWDYARP